MGAGDYSKILNMNRDAIDEELNKEFKKLAMKWHPDKNYHQHNKEESEAKFKKISEAYDVLCDPKKCQIYDFYGHYPLNCHKFNKGNGDGNVKDHEKEGVVERRLGCTLEELYEGCRKRMRISRIVPGEFDNFRSVQEILKIDIKPDWKKGTKITFPRKGNQERGAAPDDITFVVEEKPRAFFKRDGNGLVVTKKILLVDALITGKTFNLTTLDRRDLTIQVTDIAKPGYALVVHNEGKPISKEPTKKGNL